MLQQKAYDHRSQSIKASGVSRSRKTDPHPHLGTTHASKTQAECGTKEEEPAILEPGRRFNPVQKSDHLTHTPSPLRKKKCKDMKSFLCNYKHAKPTCISPYRAGKGRIDQTHLRIYTVNREEKHDKPFFISQPNLSPYILPRVIPTSCNWA